VLVRHALHRLLELLGNLTLLGALAAVGEFVFDALTLGLLDLLQLLANVLEGVVEVGMLQLLLAALSKLLHEVLQTWHVLAISIPSPLAEEALERSQQIAFFEQVVAHRVQERLGVQVQDVLRPVPVAVVERVGHGLFSAPVPHAAGGTVFVQLPIQVQTFEHQLDGASDLGGISLSAELLDSG
jgi:hypothetical protein